MGVEAIIGVVIAAVSAAAGAYSSVSAGNAAEKAAEYNAQVADNQGKAAQEAADVEAADKRRRSRYLLGTQLATSAAGGVQLEGSPLLAMVDSGVQEELDARRTRYKGYLQSVGYGSQASLSRYEGGQAQAAGYVGAGTSLLRGGYQGYRAYTKT